MLLSEENLRKFAKRKFNKWKIARCVVNYYEQAKSFEDLSSSLKEDISLQALLTINHAQATSTTLWWVRQVTEFEIAGNFMILIISNFSPATMLIILKLQQLI